MCLSQCTSLLPISADMGAWVGETDDCGLLIYNVQCCVVGYGIIENIGTFG
jgi:hypothetical protein